jgi:hypothetical protein
MQKPKIKRKKWTTSENELLKEYVSYYPENLQTAFYLAGINLERTQVSCSVQYYSKLINSKEGSFHLLSKNTAIKNKKVVRNLINKDSVIKKTKKSAYSERKKNKILSDVFKLLQKL